MKLVLLACTVFVGTAHAQMPMPKAGYLPDEATAVRLAEAILMPIYGVRQIESERPFRATLSQGIWKVEGSVRTDFGGAATIRIDKNTAAVLSYIHTK